jgi:hypothetical protein
MKNTTIPKNTPNNIQSINKISTQARAKETETHMNKISILIMSISVGTRNWQK